MIAVTCLSGKYTRSSQVTGLFYFSSVCVNAGERLSAFIAATHVMSRREAESVIRDRRVTVNDTVCTSPSFMLSREMSNYVHLDSILLRRNYRSLQSVPRLWAIQKKAEELMAHHDEKKNRLLLFNRIQPAMKAFGVQALVPVYRLPYMAEGVVLLTNDTKLCRILQTEVTSREAKLQYRIRIHGELTQSKLLALQSGFSVDGQRTAPVMIKIEHMARTMSWLRVETSELDWRKTNAAFDALYLSVRRVICTGLGSYTAQTILPSPASDQLVPVHWTVETTQHFLRLLSREADGQAS
ncbi:hypothetical protein EON65_36460 [archaeon]|nr:MAG: hypothetical protein EON65_36460 [archaeon]